MSEQFANRGYKKCILVSKKATNKLHVVVDKFFLFKQNDVSIRCQPFCDNVLFHFKLSGI